MLVQVGSLSLLKLFEPEEGYEEEAAGGDVNVGVELHVGYQTQATTRGGDQCQSGLASLHDRMWQAAFSASSLCRTLTTVVLLMVHMVVWNSREKMEHKGMVTEFLVAKVLARLPMVG